ncbi:hypothetical protein QJQ45_024198, partial [Haematococcus lacustris]
MDDVLPDVPPMQARSRYLVLRPKDADASADGDAASLFQHPCPPPGLVLLRKPVDQVTIASDIGRGPRPPPILLAPPALGPAGAGDLEDGAPPPPRLQSPLPAWWLRTGACMTRRQAQAWVHRACRRALARPKPPLQQRAIMMPVAVPRQDAYLRMAAEAVTAFNSRGLMLTPYTARSLAVVAAAVSIQSTWRGWRVRLYLQAPLLWARARAARAIQRAWRGHLLRMRLHLLHALRQLSTSLQALMVGGQLALTARACALLHAALAPGPRLWPEHRLRFIFSPEGTVVLVAPDDQPRMGLPAWTGSMVAGMREGELAAQGLGHRQPLDRACLMDLILHDTTWKSSQALQWLWRDAAAQDAQGQQLPKAEVPPFPASGALDEDVLVQVGGREGKHGEMVVGQGAVVETLVLTALPSCPQVEFSSVDEAKARAALLLALTYDPRWSSGAVLRPLNTTTIARTLPPPLSPPTAAFASTSSGGKGGALLDMHRWYSMRSRLTSRMQSETEFMRAQSARATPHDLGLAPGSAVGSLLCSRGAPPSTFSSSALLTPRQDMRLSSSSFLSPPRRPSPSRLTPLNPASRVTSPTRGSSPSLAAAPPPPTPLATCLTLGPGGRLLLVPGPVLRLPTCRTASPVRTLSRPHSLAHVPPGPGSAGQQTSSGALRGSQRLSFVSEAQLESVAVGGGSRAHKAAREREGEEGGVEAGPGQGAAQEPACQDSKPPSVDEGMLQAEVSLSLLLTTTPLHEASHSTPAGAVDAASHGSEHENSRAQAAEGVGGEVEVGSGRHAEQQAGTDNQYAHAGDSASLSNEALMAGARSAAWLDARGAAGMQPKQPPKAARGATEVAEQPQRTHDVAGDNSSSSSNQVAQPSPPSMNQRAQQLPPTASILAAGQQAANIGRDGAKGARPLPAERSPYADDDARVHAYLRAHHARLTRGGPASIARALRAEYALLSNAAGLSQTTPLPVSLGIPPTMATASPLKFEAGTQPVGSGAQPLLLVPRSTVQSWRHEARQDRLQQVIDTPELAVTTAVVQPVYLPDLLDTVLENQAMLQRDRHLEREDETKQRREAELQALRNKSKSSPLGQLVWVKHTGTGHKLVPSYQPLSTLAMTKLVAEMRIVYQLAAMEQVTTMRQEAKQVAVDVALEKEALRQAVADAGSRQSGALNTLRSLNTQSADKAARGAVTIRAISNQRRDRQSRERSFAQAFTRQAGLLGRHVQHSERKMLGAQALAAAWASTSQRRVESIARDHSIALNHADTEALNRWKAAAVRHGGYTEEVAAFHEASDAYQRDVVALRYLDLQQRRAVVGPLGGVWGSARPREQLREPLPLATIVSGAHARQHHQQQQQQQQQQQHEREQVLHAQPEQVMVGPVEEEHRQRRRRRRHHRQQPTPVTPVLAQDALEGMHPPGLPHGSSGRGLQVDSIHSWGSEATWQGQSCGMAEAPILMGPAHGPEPGDSTPAFSEDMNEQSSLHYSDDAEYIRVNADHNLNDGLHIQANAQQLITVPSLALGSNGVGAIDHSSLHTDTVLTDSFAVGSPRWDNTNMDDANGSEWSYGSGSDDEKREMWQPPTPPPLQPDVLPELPYAVGSRVRLPRIPVRPTGIV